MRFLMVQALELTALPRWRDQTSAVADARELTVGTCRGESISTAPVDGGGRRPPRASRVRVTAAVRPTRPSIINLRRRRSNSDSMSRIFPPLGRLTLPGTLPSIVL